MGSDSDDDDEEIATKKPVKVTTENLNQASIVEYFKQHLDDIKRNPNLDKFDEATVPIVDRHGDVRLELLNPPTRNYVQSDSRKGSFVKQRNRKSSYAKGNSRKASGRKASGNKDVQIVNRSRKSSTQQPPAK